MFKRNSIIISIGFSIQNPSLLSPYGGCYVISLTPTSVNLGLNPKALTSNLWTFRHSWSGTDVHSQTAFVARAQNQSQNRAPNREQPTLCQRECTGLHRASTVNSFGNCYAIFPKPRFVSQNHSKTN